MRKSQQVLVAGDQGVRLGSRGECQEWTVKRIAAIRKLDLVGHSDGFTPKQYPSGEPHLPFQVKPLSSVLMDDLKVAHKHGGDDGA